MSAATKLKTRVVYDSVTKQYVGEVVGAEGLLIVSFHRNEWDQARDAAKGYVDERSS